MRAANYVLKHVYVLIANSDFTFTRVSDDLITDLNRAAEWKTGV